MPCCFAILPDDAPTEETPRPLAVFEDLQDALEWGARHYSGGAFRVRYLEMIAIGNAKDDHRAA
jgi:hypothetical protein